MCRIIFDQLSVHQISNASGIYSGTNIPSGFRSTQKKWEGNGKVVGDRNILQSNKHLVIKKPQGD
ncbi:hypothetical protein QRD89_16790 [Halobacillus sp. ACCC02827]|uniref:hypothetical protein n=1 Tax=Bacillaceae TaxID=186817 RepID=UPI0002A4E6D5|nr:MULTISPECIES: hypothetical protein [Bacillaceae]ELK49081.1 hypothetical protein D479_00595 [Halobacillus sp. BAB-2008]QHT48126.1 hypothetical protein M662_17110 [Bacillus sp. SB49]WJE15360.1 hypothetical protein QRD89_16790 [Halobacillus sp. ACCC02827]